jgi:hypothetical protein
MPSPLCTIAICEVADDFRRPQTTFYAAGDPVWTNTDGGVFACGDTTFANYGALVQTHVSVQHLLACNKVMTVPHVIRARIRHQSGGGANDNVTSIYFGYQSVGNYACVGVTLDGNVVETVFTGAVPAYTTLLESPHHSLTEYHDYTITRTAARTYSLSIDGVPIVTNRTVTPVWSLYGACGIRYNLANAIVQNFYVYNISGGRNTSYTTFFNTEYDITPSPVVNVVKIPSGISSRIQTSKSDNRMVSISGRFMEGTSRVGVVPNSSDAVARAVGYTNPLEFLERVVDNVLPVYVYTPTFETAGIIKSFRQTKYAKGTKTLNLADFQIVLVEFRGGFKRA